MKNIVQCLVISTILLKVILFFVVHEELSLNPDEERNYKIAENSQYGNGYTLYDEEKQEYISTAFHASFSVFVFEYLINHGIAKEVWVLFIHFASVGLFAISIKCFYEISRIFLKNEKFSLFSTIAYCFYPSTLFYIGPLFFYENLVLPLLVIVIYRTISALKNSLHPMDYFTIPGIVTISCLLRPQMIMIYLLVFTVCILFSAKKFVMIFLASLFLGIAAHTPLLVKNKNIFGEYILSTQSGFELLQGHNPTARGSWMGGWREPDNDFFQYAHAEIGNLRSLNELEESKARRDLALRWIKENPLEEVKLLIRKVAIYFLPQNFGALPGAGFPNPVNLFTHILFLCFVLRVLFRKSLGFIELLLMSPIAASVILSLVFFVGYRWRYYAEPFMVILAFRFLLMTLELFGKKPVQNAEETTSSYSFR